MNEPNLIADLFNDPSLSLECFELYSIYAMELFDAQNARHGQRYEEWLLAHNNDHSYDEEFVNNYPDAIEISVRENQKAAYLQYKIDDPRTKEVWPEDPYIRGIVEAIANEQAQILEMAKMINSNDPIISASVDTSTIQYEKALALANELIRQREIYKG